MLDSQDLIDGYLDETLTPDQSAAFVHWLHESPQNRQRFAEAVWLHDRLRGEFLAVAALTSKTDPSVASRRVTETPRASKTRSRSAISAPSITRCCWPAWRRWSPWRWGWCWAMPTAPCAGA